MWILFQTKRFFSIFWKESFLFIKNTYNNINKKSKIKINKLLKHNNGVPVLHRDLKIVLDKKYYDFYSLQPKLSKPFYLKSPLFMVINKNKKNIFNNLLFIIEKSYDFKFKIGIELEFYILDNINNINILKELKKLLPFVKGIEKEKGSGQFEIKTNPYTDIKLLVSDYLRILDILKVFAKNNCLKLILDPLPFEGDCGSSLQVNLSIITSDNNNLFAREKINGKLCESKIMINSIAGLLKNTNNNLLLFIKDKYCLDRFDIEKNKKIKSNNKYPAPTFISWGVNNRSTSIRIPTPQKIDLESYMKDDTENRRIEYRVPSANADIYLVIIGVLTAIIEGIDEKLLPYIDKTSFDVLEKNDCLEKIEDNFEIINDIFKINKDILFY